jgi:hypothetical protein
MDDLEKMLAKLLERARKLPPGQKRHDLLKEIGRFRVKLDALKKQKNPCQRSKAASVGQPTLDLNQGT